MGKIIEDDPKGAIEQLQKAEDIDDLKNIIKKLKVNENMALGFLDSKRQTIAMYLEKVMNHVASNPDSKACKVVLNIIVENTEKKLLISLEIKSVTPRNDKTRYTIGSINLDDGQLKLFD